LPGAQAAAGNGEECKNDQEQAKEFLFHVFYRGSILARFASFQDGHMLIENGKRRPALISL